MALKGNMAGKKPEDAKQTAENRGEPQTGEIDEATRFCFYLPLVSTFAFSSSFIIFTIGSRLVSPWVVAGGALLGMELLLGSILGRVWPWQTVGCLLPRRRCDQKKGARQ